MENGPLPKETARLFYGMKSSYEENSSSISAEGTKNKVPV